MCTQRARAEFVVNNCDSIMRCASQLCHVAWLRPALLFGSYAAGDCCAVQRCAHAEAHVAPEWTQLCLWTYVDLIMSIAFVFHSSNVYDDGMRGSFY